MNAPIKLPPDPTEIISRAEAKARGLTRYFTGKPCRYGHTTERLVSGKDCVGCYSRRRAMPAAKKGHAKWQRENKEWKSQWNKENRFRLSQYEREARKKNPERFRKKEKKKYLNGPSNPKDEIQWLRKNKVQLRNLKRYLRNPSLEQSASSQPET